MFPACYFAGLPASSTARSAPRLHSLFPVCPENGCFHAQKPVAVSFADSPNCLTQHTLPFGIFASLRIEAFGWICRPAARLPNSPDLRSLPAARRYLTRFGLRITVPGPLRFRRLAVPQTSWNLPHYARKPLSGQHFDPKSHRKSTRYFSFVSLRLQGPSRAFPVEKSGALNPVLRYCDRAPARHSARGNRGLNPLASGTGVVGGG